MATKKKICKTLRAIALHLQPVQLMVGKKDSQTPAIGIDENHTPFSPKSNPYRRIKRAFKNGGMEREISKYRIAPQNIEKVSDGLAKLIVL